MPAKIYLLAVLIAALGVAAYAQAPAEQDTENPAGETWRTSRTKPQADPAAADGEEESPEAVRPKSSGRAAHKLKPADLNESNDQPGPAAGRSRVTRSKPVLPTGSGQTWQEYDIRAYTARVDSTNRPEQAIVDWILRETGYEVWHTAPLGFMTADDRTLTVYHTPAMQAIVADVVDRFVNSTAESQAFGLRVITIDNPNWRARAQRVLRPVPVQTQGVQAWLLQAEDAALLLTELSRRTDYREHASPQLLVNNGQSTVVSATRARSYVRDVALNPAGWPGFENAMGQIDEGFTLELSPLLSLDGSTIDAVLKCNIDQLEKLLPVAIDVPTAAAPRQRTKIEVPQFSHCRLHERFRWPANQVLLVSLGVVATPVPTDRNAIMASLPIPSAPPRSDLLVMVEARGNVAPTVPTATRSRTGDSKSYHGRY